MLDQPEHLGDLEVGNCGFPLFPGFGAPNDFDTIRDGHKPSIFLGASMSRVSSAMRANRDVGDETRQRKKIIK